MPTFIDQPGVPLITVALTCTEGRSTLGLSQQRFLLDAPRPARGSDERWQVPICVKAAGHSDAPCEVLEAAERSVTLAGRCLPWVFVNAGAHGYYRTEYPSDVLRAIARDIENTLTAAERLSLAGDEWALVRAGRHNVAGYLTLVSALARESSAGVLEMVVDRLGILHEYVTTDATRAPFEAFVRALLRPALDQLGFAAKPDDPDPSRQLRAVLVGTLGTTGGDAGVIAQSRAALDAALNGGAPLDPTLAGPIIEVAAEHGDARLYDALLAAAAKATSPEEHYRHLYATTDFHDPALIERSLQFAISPQLRAQDTAIYLAQLLGNPAARARTWAFIKEHWAALEPKITIAEGDGTLAGSLSAFCDADARDDMTAFFAAHKLPVASRTLDQTIERINNCIALRERQTPALADWLKSR